MHMIWKEKRMFDVKEERLLDEKWQIITKNWFLDLELKEIKGKAMGATQESDKNNCDSLVGFCEEENVMCENECHVVLEDTCLNQDKR